MKILVTGGTVFVSRFVAEYFAEKHEVYVLNRGTRPQAQGVFHIKGDRHNLGSLLKNYTFDVVLDVTAYTKTDVDDLLDGLGNFGKYIMISSSAVYPETLSQPFREEYAVGENKIWGDYGLNKISAEKTVLERVPDAYILRPPYLYGKMNNLYREAFVFECAERNRLFYVPKEGQMPLQFFDIEDLCRFIELLLEKMPSQRIFNVGNPDVVDINEWVRLCYSVLGKEPRFISVDEHINQRDYFPFYDYGYRLDVSEMLSVMPDVKPLEKGLSESDEWFRNNRDQVRRKNYIDYIECNF